MDRSLYPEGVEVHQEDLERTEATRTFHITQRHNDITELGVVDGLEVTINSGLATLIDIAPGKGYCPNGEFIELENSQIGLSLADYSNNALNYVIAVYTETNNKLSAHETNGNSYPTEANRSVRIRVIVESEYEALPNTDDDLNNDALDRSLVLAVISANGVGTSLTSSDIELPTTFNSAISADNTTDNITGVNILSVDRTTNTGIGLLDYQSSGVSLRWRAPGDSNYGPSVPVSLSGTYTLTSISGKTLDVVVIATNLPVSNETDNISISNIYTQTIFRNSAEDLHHRSLLGSGTPTTRNPHGLTLSDLGGAAGEIEVHQDLQHENGIFRGSDPNVLGGNPGVVVGSPDEFVVQAIDVGDVVYLGGEDQTSLNSSVVTFTDVGDDKQSLWDIYILKGDGGLASLEKVRRLEYDDIPTENSGTNNMADVCQLRDIHINTPAGAAEIHYDDTIGALSFKLSTDANFGVDVSHNNRVLIPTTGDAALRLFNETGEYYLDVFASDYANWTAVTGANQSQALTIISSLTSSELNIRLRIHTIVYSGNFTGDLGNGFGAGHSPNTYKDQRLFGTLGLDQLRDDARYWLSSQDLDPAASPATYSDRNVGIGTKYPHRKLHITTGGINEPALLISRDDSARNGVDTQGMEFRQHAGPYIRQKSITVNKKFFSFECIDLESGGTPAGNLGFSFKIGTDSALEEYLSIQEDGEIRISHPELALLRLRGENNSAEKGSSIRFVESYTTFVGNYIKYDNDFNGIKIGSHTASDEDPLNDSDSIRIYRNDGKVQLLKDLEVLEATTSGIGVLARGNDSEYFGGNPSLIYRSAENDKKTFNIANLDDGGGSTSGSSNINFHIGTSGGGYVTPLVMSTSKLAIANQTILKMGYWNYDDALPSLATGDTYLFNRGSAFQFRTGSVAVGGVTNWHLSTK